MQVKITKNIITATLPEVSIGDERTVSDEFGRHLVEIGAAEIVATYETKIIEEKPKTKKKAKK